MILMSNCIQKCVKVFFHLIWTPKTFWLFRFAHDNSQRFYLILFMNECLLIPVRMCDQMGSKMKKKKQKKQLFFPPFISLLV